MNKLNIYNTLAREKQLFVPIVPGEVRIYVCGVTVYDYCHLGHARVMVVFDIVRRWFSAIGFRVIFVQNITDIDDKIIQRALQNQETIHDLTERFIHYFQRDVACLGVLPVDHAPRATHYIEQMCAMIQTLEKKAFAYQTSEGDVYFSVRQFAQYGRLSRQMLAELQPGERAQPQAKKRDPLDFVLWKRAQPDTPKQAQWPSPWGLGRPGWHIECSAMSCLLLGDSFDIHGGGEDLQFPHHENEIAQSEAASGKTFVHYWMHNGFVHMHDQKMSKSLGNVILIRDLLREYDGEVIRFFILRTLYRQPLRYHLESLNDARSRLTRLYIALKQVVPDNNLLDWQEDYAQRFAVAMNDDFNTPMALSVLFELANAIHKQHSVVLARQLKALGAVLGILQQDPMQFLKGAQHLDSAAIEQRIEDRWRAKQEKDYEKADRIRQELLQEGILLEDHPERKTEWRKQ